ncbi:2'-hydroxyisoflavone reductase [Kribbella sp. VKM Ac-2571]|uniref:NAD-dependent dehydratase n=1 Tax=Kribbella sp. VKM Ac-2571 TaxID=2512222 RepID=UPI00105BA063|nr:NAD-dependent dehydratase [Kribbella sp. VKM Ac-2571]TDO68721.1 2'-hydroxyisoflavone reductase [Kribbella sp. VKM Ac-2571]
MRLLVLGGTKNLGRHVVEAALANGHEVTLFNRGQTNPGLFPSVRRIVGDRAAPEALAAGEWDGVIDMSGLLVRDVSLSASVLRDRCGHYTYMSSIAVYASKTTPGMTESAPLLPWPAGAPEDHFTMDLYGPSKVRNESLLTATFGARTAAVRSGFVVGPYNPDFGNWGWALAHNLPMECAARPDQPIQYIDARDLAAFLLHLTVNRISGPFNAVGPTHTMTHLADAWRTAVPDPPPMDWSPAVDRFHLPHDGSNDSTFRLDNSRALSAGLHLRPDAETARDYIAWVHDGNIPPEPPH